MPSSSVGRATLHSASEQEEKKTRVKKLLNLNLESNSDIRLGSKTHQRDLGFCALERSKI